MQRALLLVALIGCTPPIPSNGNPDGGAGMGDSPFNTSTTRFYVYGGQAPTTATIQFGGTPYCDYTVKQTDIIARAIVTDDQQLVATSIENTRVETSINMCPYEGSPPNRQVFEYGGAPIAFAADGSVVAKPKGAMGNQPATDATVSILATADPPTAAIHWARTDQPAPLDWQVDTTTPIRLNPVSCNPGALSCIGNREGWLLECADDSLAYKLAKRCAAGCADERTCN